jgi:hypothetical protein
MAKPQITICALAATLGLLSFPPACGAETPRASAMRHVTGEKLDSGLGELPPYREWAHHAATRKLVVATNPVVRVASKKP